MRLNFRDRYCTKHLKENNKKFGILRNYLLTSSTLHHRRHINKRRPTSTVSMIIVQSIPFKMVGVSVVNNSSYQGQDTFFLHLPFSCNDSLILLTGFFGLTALYFKTRPIRENKPTHPSYLVVALFFVLAIIIGPFLIIVFVVFTIYRSLVYLYLRRRLGQHFGGLLKGPDVFWAMETPEARSIINVLVLLQVSSADVTFSRGCYGKRLLDDVRQVTKRSLLNPLGRFPKLMQFRGKSSLGYHYWINPQDLQADSFVRCLEIKEDAADGLTENELREIIGECCNKPLPYYDTATWEVLVGQQHMSTQAATTDKLFPILFRIHHTVGDGVALLRLLIEGIADRSSKTPTSIMDKKKSWANLHGKLGEEDSGYENDSHESLFKDPIPSAIKTQTKAVSRSNLKTKLRGKLESLRTAITPEKKQTKTLKKSLAAKLSAVRRWRRNTVSGVPLVFELKKDEATTLEVRPINTDTIAVDAIDNTLENSLPESDVIPKTPETSFQFDEETKPRLFFTIPSCRDIGILLTISVIVTGITVSRALIVLSDIFLPLVLRALKFTFFTPHIIFYQLYGSTDDRVLYGKPLSGNKVVSWIAENDMDENLKLKIRLIRKKLGVKFTHILFACLSRSLSNFYLNYKGDTPSTINMVLPARVDVEDLAKGLQTTASFKVGALRGRVTRFYDSRRVLRKPFEPENCKFSSSSESDQEEMQNEMRKLHKDLSNTKITRKLELDNKFTVAMMKLPVSDDTIFTDLVNLIRIEYERLRKAPDYVVNYWLLRWVAHLAPIPFLKPYLGSAPCSLVLSNLPGPENKIHLAKKPIHSIVFWVPNRGQNGVGMGVLSYCQNFSLGIIADKVLIAHPQEAHQIISGIFDEADSLVDIFRDHSND